MTDTTITIGLDALDVEKLARHIAPHWFESNIGGWTRKSQEPLEQKKARETAQAFIDYLKSHAIPEVKAYQKKKMTRGLTGL